MKVSSPRANFKILYSLKLYWSTGSKVNLVKNYIFHDLSPPKSTTLDL